MSFPSPDDFPGIDPVDELVLRDQITDDEAAAIKDFREEPDEVKSELFGSLGETAEIIGTSDIPAMRGLAARLRAALEDPDLDRPPMVMDASLWDGEGLTQEEWEALDQSAKDTLRSPRHNQ